MNECVRLHSELDALYACVDAFALEMKEKLKHKYLNGYRGWDNEMWTPDQIIEALKDHLYKPNRDMVDIANIAMFHWNREVD
jgi:hypothetical protein